MGAFEGAGITVLAKGLEFHGQAPWSDGTEQGAFPTATTILTGTGNVTTTADTLAVGDANQFCHTGTYSSTGAFTITSQTNPYPSNFMCNPSSIDGLTVTNSSQGGGGIFAHGWAHHLQIANNRVYNNSGTLTGGISVGQGEFATPYVAGGTTNAAPGSCSNGTGWTTNQHEPYCLQLEVNVHNNYVTSNSSLGDELFSATLAGGGGVTFCTGNDYYKFNYNWVCGNLSTGEGGGVVHLGEIQYGDIEHNSILFNQSQNPTIPTNGGGIQVQGTPDTDPVCVGIPDADCPPGLSDGTGHGLVINANLIQGNSADSGSGGGIRLQQVNGTEVSTFNTKPSLWNSVSITNNLITNNVAGWDGGGISLQDSLNVSIINNTISNNDSLATSGVLTQSIGTPLSSAPAGNCVQSGPTGPTTASCPQSAGVTSMQNSSLLTTTFAVPITCPTGQPNCTGFSNPLLKNNLIWQNRSFYIGITGPGAGTINQQNLIALFPAFSSTAALPQNVFGQCTSGVSYWDVGVRGDTGPSNHGSGFTLSPTYSVLDDPADYSTGHNLGTSPGFASQYCNGSRVPPTCSVADGCGGPSGYGVPPGIADAQTPNPVFSLTPSATVDEGNNWINVSWGPIAASDDSLAGADGNYGGGALFANYTLTAGSSAIDYVPLNATNLPTAADPALAMDFFGNPRPDPSNPTHFDVGAAEFQGANTPPSFVSISPTTGYRGTSVAVTITGTNLNALSSLTVSGTGVTVTGAQATSSTTITATFTISATAALSSRNVVITTGGGTVTATGAFTVLGPSLTSISPASGGRGTTVPVTLTGADLQGATGVTMSGTGVTCTLATPAPTSTTVNASCVITGTAALTARNVTVATTNGNATLTAAFTVGGGPTLTAVTPTSGERGTTVAVALTGTSLQGATGVTMSGAGITCTLSGTPTATTVNASCVIAATAGLTARNVTVATTNGNAVLNAAFTVTGATVAFSAPSPVLTTTPANTSTKAGTITVSNAAAATGPLTLTAAPTITKSAGNAASAFSITGGTCGSGTVVPPGGSCTINVQYAPGGVTTTATAHVTITGSGLAAATLNSGNFNGN